MVFLLTFFLVFEKVKWLCISQKRGMEILKKIKRDITEVDEEHSTKQSLFLLLILPFVYYKKATKEKEKQVVDGECFLLKLSLKEKSEYLFVLLTECSNFLI